jgi:hypothetical protein
MNIRRMSQRLLESIGAVCTCKSLSVGTCLMATTLPEALCSALYTEPYDLQQDDHMIKIGTISRHAHFN